MARKPKAAVDKTADDRGRRIGDLAMVWHHARRYPGQIAIAGAALVTTSAATVAIPYGFKRVIDRGFGGSGSGDFSTSFHYLLMIVVVLALATAVRFYFVSLLGERVVADIRREVQSHLLRLSPRFFEENRPSEIASRLTSDTAQIEMVVGSTVSIALRNCFTGIGGLIYLFAISPKLTGLLRAEYACSSSSPRSSCRWRCSAAASATIRALRRIGSPTSARSSPRRWAR